MRTIRLFALALVWGSGFVAAGESSARSGLIGEYAVGGVSTREVRSLATTTFTVTVCSPVNGSVTPIPGPHTYASWTGAIAIQATPAGSYRLRRWVVSGGVAVAKATAASTTMTVTGDGTLCPEFEKLIYHVEVGAPVNGSVSLSPGPHTYDGGAGPIAIQATPAACYRFARWVASGGVTVATVTAASTTMTVTGDGTLRAEFEKITYTVNICTPAHGSISPAPGNHTYDGGAAPIAIQATPAASYRFKRWTVGGGVSVAGATAAGATMTLAGDGTLCAEFEKITYTYTVNIGTPAHGAVAPAPGEHTYDDGATVSIQATADACYGFRRWSAEGGVSVANSTAARTTMTVTGDGRVCAVFELLACPVSVGAPVNGSVAPAPGVHNYDCGTTLSIRATPAPCCRFVRWVAGGGVRPADATAASTTMTVTGAGTLDAEFEKMTCTIQIQNPVGGWVLPSPGPYTYDCGSQVAVRAVPDPDHEFQQWTVSGAVAVDHATSAQARITITGAGTLQAVFIARTRGLPPGSLGQLDFTDPLVSALLVTTNDTPALTYADRVIGLLPDPTGMLRLRVLENLPARAKGRFAKGNAGPVLVRFQYLFPSITPSELTVYLSDVPEVRDSADPLRVRHYVSLGRIANPQTGRPGGPGSGQFGVFAAWAPVGSLDLSQGTWVELDLAGIPAEDGTSSGSVYTDNWSVEVNTGLSVLDVDPSRTVTVQDFLRVVASCGRPAILDTDGTDRVCLEGAFSRDGYVDLYDAHGWAWVLNDPARRSSCGGAGVRLPLTSGPSVATSSLDLPAPAPAGPVPIHLDAVARDLLILGKTRMSSAGAFEDLLDDCLGFFNSNGTYAGSYAPSGFLPTRCNVQLVRGPAGSLYIVNTEHGLVRIDGAVTTVVPPGAADYADEPRYRCPAKVYVGLQSDGPHWFGRPLLDAAVATEEEGKTYAYVVPVVVQPFGKDAADAYEAAARLELNPPGSDEPYRVSLLYDDPCQSNDNQYRNALREIELDRFGNVYVLNVHRLNESCTLWKYAAGDALFLLRRASLQGPLGPATPIQVEDPLALHVSADGGTLYVAAGQCSSKVPGAAVLYGLSTQSLALVRTITIQNMPKVTSIADDPATGALWVAGFTTPEFLTPCQSAPPPSGLDFATPVLAKVPRSTNVLPAAPIADPTIHNLALPTSLLWAGR